MRRGGGGGIGNELCPKTPGVSNLGQFVRRDRRLAYLQRVDVETIGFSLFLNFPTMDSAEIWPRAAQRNLPVKNSGYIML